MNETHHDSIPIATGTGKVLAHTQDGVGFIVFNQPEKRNALAVEMQRALPDLLERFENDNSIRVVVMRGAGREAFASGADISEFEAQRSSADARAEFDRAWGATTRAFEQFEKPVIAMIHGICFGGGLATALHADIRLASDDARFTIPAARLGLGYGLAGVERLLQFVSPSTASEILFTARPMNAHEALRVGLVDLVVPADQLEAELERRTRRIADNAPLTLRAAKAAIREASRASSERDAARVAQLVRECFESEDYREGRRAFLEKRPPHFRGR
jgi:enoyl-CoA hydratase/carnithine racemase